MDGRGRRAPVAGLARRPGPSRTGRRVVVGDDLTVPGHPEIFVIGDMMSLHELPGVAEVAMQTGMYAGRRIRRRLAGRAGAKPFRYYDLGSAAYISRGTPWCRQARSISAAFPAGLPGCSYTWAS